MAAGLTYTPIMTMTPATLATSITLSSIPATYTDLVLVISTKPTGGVQSYIYFNGVNTGTNCGSTILESNTSGVTATSELNSSQIWLSAFNAVYNSCVVTIPKYASTTLNKTILFRLSQWLRTTQGFGAYNSTAAISSITIVTGGTQTWALTSQFTLYGITAA